MKRRASSAVIQLSALILATIVCVEVISFALVLGMPAPEPKRVTIRMVSDVLNADAEAPSGTLRRSIAAGPPAGTRAPLIEEAMASLYGTERDRLRATWTGDNSVQLERAPRLSERNEDGRSSGAGPGPLVPETGTPNSPDPVFLTLENLPFPPFRVAIRQENGTWLTVEPREPWLTAWQVQMLAAFLISALLLIPIAIFTARRFTRPLRDLAQFAGTDDEPMAPAPIFKRTREIGAVVNAIVRMRDRLARRADQRVRILAAVAHDLRTPMTGLRLRVEDATEPDRTRMIADLDRMEEMISHMLNYARDGVGAHHVEPVDVRAVAARVATSFPPAAVLIVQDNGDTAELMVDAKALERAIGNLVRNAIDYGGLAEIEVRPSQDNIAIRVHDRGPGIAVEERARVLLPFERGDGSRNRRTGGVGLGLSIVDEFAQRYSGELRLLDRPGGGLSAEIILPVGEPADVRSDDVPRTGLEIARQPWKGRLSRPPRIGH